MTPQQASDILGVKLGAPLGDVEAAFRRMAMKYHPDRNRGADAARRFKAANEARQVLASLPAAPPVKPVAPTPAAPTPTPRPARKRWSKKAMLVGAGVLASAIVGYVLLKTEAEPEPELEKESHA